MCLGQVISAVENNPDAEIVAQVLAHYLSEKNRTQETFEFLVRKAALCNPEPKVTELLLSFCNDVNSQDSNGLTPLHMASRGIRQKNVVKFLLEKGAKTGLVENNNNSSLSLAAEHNCVEVILWMICAAEEEEFLNRYENDENILGKIEKNSTITPTEKQHLISLIWDKMRNAAEKR